MARDRLSPVLAAQDIHQLGLHGVTINPAFVVKWTNALVAGFVAKGQLAQRSLRSAPTSDTLRIVTELTYDWLQLLGAIEYCDTVAIGRAWIIDLREFDQNIVGKMITALKEGADVCEVLINFEPSKVPYDVPIQYVELARHLAVQLSRW